MHLPLLCGRPHGIGLVEGRLKPCPDSPNCVCSDHEDRRHSIEPLQLAAAPESAWPAIRQLVRSLPRTKIISDSNSFLHAECRSRLLGFVDDLQLHLRPDQGVIAIRSASRVGYSDLGVNRRRVEALRTRLREQKIVV